MTVEEIIALSKKWEDVEYTHVPNSVLNGLKILAKYGDVQVAAEHDEIFAGAGKVESILKRDAEEMFRNHWNFDVETESWHKFV